MDEEIKETKFPTVPKRRHTKDERELVKQIQDHFSQAKMAQENNCYWESQTDSTVASMANGSGGNWKDVWDRQEKMALPWFEKPSRDDYESNVKSPMTVGRIESTIQKLRKVNLQFTVRPEDSDSPKDVRKARVIQELLNNLFAKKNFKHRLITWMYDSLIHGVGFLQIYYLKKERTVSIPVTNVKQMSPEEKKQAKDGNTVYRTLRNYEYDDIAIEPVKIQEMYIDPSARYLHGESYEAQWAIRRMLPSMDQFKAMYSGDPDAKNIEKVRPIGSYAGEDTEFFEPPKDVADQNVVELLHYYNKADDLYVVLANDVVIKEIPLPYVHKKLPFVMSKVFEVPHQFYHAGLPDRLVGIQTETEILKNMHYDKLHDTINPMWAIKRNIYGEVSKAIKESSAGLMVPVNDRTDITAIETPATPYDMFQELQLLSSDASLATQIDPSQMGVAQKYVSATTSMLTKEQMDTFIFSLIDSFSEPLTVAGYQIISLMRQFYTVPKVVEKIGETITRSRKVRLDGLEINPNTFEVVHKKTGEYSFFEIKEDYFDINGDWDVIIAPESMETISRAVEMQKSQAALAQMAPFMVDPTDKRAMMAHPTPWIDGPKTIRWYCETNSIPTDLLVRETEDEDIAIDRAELQGKRMLKGDSVPGIPGESEAHKRVHVEQLHTIRMKVEDMEKEFGELGPMAMAYADVLPITESMNNEKAIQRIISLHLAVDDMPAAAIEQEAVKSAQPAPAVPMPPGLNAQGGGQPPIPPGGNQQNGMMPQPQGGEPPVGTGRPPLAVAGM